MPTTTMTKKKKASISTALPLSSSLPWTLEERVQRIESMGRRIEEYIRFMCRVGSLAGASDEVKAKAVTAFYDQMVVVERQLGRIHDGLRLE